MTGVSAAIAFFYTVLFARLLPFADEFQRAHPSLVERKLRREGSEEAS